MDRYEKKGDSYWLDGQLAAVRYLRDAAGFSTAEAVAYCRTLREMA